MREVLADTGLVGEGEVDGGVHLGGLGLVVEVLVDLLIELMQDHQRIVTAMDVEGAGEVFERIGRLGELAWEQHLPEVTLFHQMIELGPGVGREEGGNPRGGLNLDEGFGHDDQLRMLAGNVEVMDVVGEVVAVAEDTTARADGEVKGETALILVAARVHTRLHHAFADGIAVEELGQGRIE